MSRTRELLQRNTDSRYSTVVDYSVKSRYPMLCLNTKIERLWQDLHAAVTRNHRCRTMSRLMQHVYRFLERRERRTARLYVRQPA